jgi:hypothetical protein
MTIFPREARALIDSFVNSEILQQLGRAGLSPEPVRAGGAPFELAWTVDSTDPLLDSRVLLVLPDLHLDESAGGEVARLERFLKAVVLAKARLQARGRALSVCQLGDFHARSDTAFRDAHRRIESLLIDELDTRFCLGNRDWRWSRSPPAWGFTAGRIGHSQRFCRGRVFAFHGHQGDPRIDTLLGDAPALWNALGASLASISSPADALVEARVADWEELAPEAGESSAWPEGVNPGASTPFRAARWSDCGERPARFRRALEAAHALAPAITNAIRLVLVGHSHRPGLSWFELAGRVVPVLDVGSFCHGQSQFALVEEGSASVWQL